MAGADVGSVHWQETGVQSGKRQHYQPDLTAHLALCEANYVHLMRLMPLMREQAERVFSLPQANDHTRCVRLRVLEQAPYTTLLELHEESAFRGSVAGRDLMLRVRVYHDARVAEVISLQEKRIGHVRYAVPNAEMFQPDEKRQCNDLLGQCLKHWRDEGLGELKMCTITRFQGLC